MYKREELFESPEYWFETLQNELYRQVSGYIESEKMTQTQLAEKLGVSKGYISQIMNGNFNYTLKKLIELSLAIGKAPVIEFKEISEIIKQDNSNRYSMEYSNLFSFNTSNNMLYLKTGKASNTSLEQDQYMPSNLKVA